MFWVVLPVVMIALGAAVYPQSEDTSFAERTSKPLLTADKNKDGKIVKISHDAPEERPKGVVGHENASDVENRGSSHGRSGGSLGYTNSGTKYRATQIVHRQGGNPDRILPVGTSFIGKLLTGIDTRHPNSLVRVLAPYGGSFDHERRIERNAVLFGMASYPGQNEKVYVQFNRVLFPDGREFRINAEALGSGDYSPGILCDESDGAGSRVMTTVGLTMLSGISDALVEKESLGQWASPTVKSNLRNGLFNGLTKATNEEAGRRAAKINDVKDYCTTSAGESLIISLTETFKGEQL